MYIHKKKNNFNKINIIKIPFIKKKIITIDIEEKLIHKINNNIDLEKQIEKFTHINKNKIKKKNQYLLNATFRKYLFYLKIFIKYILKKRLFLFIVFKIFIYIILLAPQLIFLYIYKNQTISDNQNKFFLQKIKLFKKSIHNIQLLNLIKKNFIKNNPNINFKTIIDKKIKKKLKATIKEFSINHINMTVNSLYNKLLQYKKKKIFKQKYIQKEFKLNQDLIINREFQNLLNGHIFQNTNINKIKNKLKKITDYYNKNIFFIEENIKKFQKNKKFNKSKKIQSSILRMLKKKNLLQKQFEIINIILNNINKYDQLFLNIFKKKFLYEKTQVFTNITGYVLIIFLYLKEKILSKISSFVNIFIVFNIGLNKEIQPNGLLYIINNYLDTKTITINNIFLYTEYSIFKTIQLSNISNFIFSLFIGLDFFCIFDINSISKYQISKWYFNSISIFNLLFIKILLLNILNLFLGIFVILANLFFLYNENIFKDIFYILNKSLLNQGITINKNNINKLLSSNINTFKNLSKKNNIYIITILIIYTFLILISWSIIISVISILTLKLQDNILLIIIYTIINTFFCISCLISTEMDLKTISILNILNKIESLLNQKTNLIIITIIILILLATFIILKQYIFFIIFNFIIYKMLFLILHHIIVFNFIQLEILLIFGILLILYFIIIKYKLFPNKFVYYKNTTKII